MTFEYSIFPSPSRTNDQLRSVIPGYATGYWTPGISFGGAITGITYTQQYGTFVKLGRLVYATFTITLSNNGSSIGNAQVTDFPFTARPNTASAGGSVSFFSTLLLPIFCMHLDMSSNSNSADIRGITTASSNSINLDETYIGNTTIIRGSIYYETLGI